MQVGNIVPRLESVFREVFGDNSIFLTTDSAAKDIDELDSLTHIQMSIVTSNDFM